MQSCCPMRMTCTLPDDVWTTSRPGPRQILAWVAQFYAVLHPVSCACHAHVIHTHCLYMLSAHVIRTCHSHTSSAHVIHMCTSSAYAICMCPSSTCTHVICTSSVALLMVSMDLNYLSTLKGTGYWMEFVTRMLSSFISGSCKWFMR